FLSWELKPTELEDLGLRNALSSFVREWSSQYGVQAEFQSSLPDDIGLTREIETNLYRITQEALNNVLRHAKAETVNVLLQRRRSDIVLIIEDNGTGFDESNGSRSGLGLTGMRERAALLKGELQVDSQPGEGTTIIVRVPSHEPTGTSAATA
ncbi:MAG: PAS sensor protein, partial [Acidobacteria bacterium]|nr:PAS sensor protein [Acidobacteriota bacterium]